MKAFFSKLDYWTLEPHDKLIASHASRAADRAVDVEVADRHFTKTQVPGTTYWCLADLRKTYVLYVRGTTEPVVLALEGRSATKWATEQFDPRTGARRSISGPIAVDGRFAYRAPNTKDWIVIVRMAN